MQPERIEPVKPHLCGSVWRIRQTATILITSRIDSGNAGFDWEIPQRLRCFGMKDFSEWQGLGEFDDKT